MLKIKLQPYITLMLCLLTGMAFADTRLPNHYPPSFEISGTITKVYKKRKVIALDGAHYRLHPVHDIFTLSKNSRITLYSLKRGMKVGAEFGIYKGKKVLTKIWVLPKKYPTQPHAV